MGISELELEVEFWTFFLFFSFLRVFWKLKLWIIGENPEIRRLDFTVTDNKQPDQSYTFSYTLPVISDGLGGIDPGGGQ